MPESKTLFITGASSGIGAQTARQAVAAGWNVGLFARSEDKIAKLAEELGDRTLALPGDVADRNAQAAALDRLTGKFGGIDAAFANAGTGVTASGTEGGDPAEWHDMIHANVMGVLYTAHAALPHLRKRKGHFVVTGSAAGRRHIKGRFTARPSGLSTGSPATLPRRCRSGAGVAPLWPPAWSIRNSSMNRTTVACTPRTWRMP